LDCRTARIPKSKDPGNLVECLAGGVIPRSSDNRKVAMPADDNQFRMST
jgi:hypothetical protein